MTRFPVRRLVPVVVAFGFLLYVPRIALGDGILPAYLPVARIEAIGGFAKLLSLVAGAVFGLRCAARLEADNPARPGWRLLGLWLLGFAVGQAGLMTYSIVLGRTPPLPSIGDAGFLAGYLLIIAATARFIAVYRASGFPVGSARQHLAIAVGAAALFVAIGVPLLTPIARAPVPPAERAINLAYPILDFVALVPTLVMIRITRAFRGGKVWTVWAALLAGFVCMAVGDIAFAYLASAKMNDLAPLVDLMLLFGYFFAACGTMLQHEVLTE
jgi:hypothetical protein